MKQNIEDLLIFLKMEASKPLVSDTSLDKVLNNIRADATQANIKVSELEILIKLSQQLEKNPSNEVNLTEVKRRIFHLLGFQTSVALRSKLPLIVPEQSIHLFRFYHGNKIQDGIRYNDEIYGFVKCFDVMQRLQVYQLAWALSEKEVPIVLTASQHQYRFWVNLKSPAYAVLRHQNATLLRMALFLYACRRKEKYAVMSQGQEKEESLWL